MIPKELKDIDEKLLNSLCDDRWQESQTLDFKQILPRKTEADENEFAKDVCAFANADGGDIVYGIAEKEGRAKALHPITEAPMDPTQRRLLQMLDSRLEPRVPGVRLWPVPVDDGNVLVVRVPASYLGPHCVRVNQQRRFVMRNGTTTSDLTFDQLRSAFDRTATLAEKASLFIERRQAEMIAGRTLRRLNNGPRCAVHLVPIAAFSGRTTVDLERCREAQRQFLRQEEWQGGGPRFSLDGLTFCGGSPRQEPVVGYTHVFRTGALEGAEACSSENPSVIFAQPVVAFLHWAVSTFADAATRWNFGGPALLGFAVLDCLKRELRWDNEYAYRGRPVLDRQHVPFPPYWIGDIANFDVRAAVEDRMEILWQAFGFAEAPALEKVLDQ